jgi:N-acetylneuraminate synthase
MQRVIDLTKELIPYFTRSERACIVTNVGGFSHSGHIAATMREELYWRLEQSIRELDMTGVDVVPQTMPPFPWHFGGQQFHNIFVEAASIAKFCERNSMRVCLDVSHSKLACSYLRASFWDFLKKVGPYAAHLHIADAAGIDGEGLQVGAGEIDWKMFFQIIDEYAPVASFIPEVWQGHKDDNEGAWLALERLEKIAARTSAPRHDRRKTDVKSVDQVYETRATQDHRR